MRQGRITGIHGYAMSALLMGLAMTSVRDVQHVRNEYEKPRKPIKHSGPVTDSSRETKREKRRRLKDAAR